MPPDCERAEGNGQNAAEPFLGTFSCGTVIDSVSPRSRASTFPTLASPTWLSVWSRPAYHLPRLSNSDKTRLRTRSLLQVSVFFRLSRASRRLQKLCYQAGPSGLMRCTRAASCVPMKILMKQDVILEIRVAGQLWMVF